MDEIKIEFMQADFGKLELKAGDILVLKFQDFLTEVNRERIQERIKVFLPEGTKCLILDGNTDIGILRNEIQMAQVEA